MPFSRIIICAFLFVIVSIPVNSKGQVHTETGHLRLKRDKYDDFLKGRLAHEKRMEEDAKEWRRKKEAADRERKGKAARNYESNYRPPPSSENERKQTQSSPWIWIILGVVISIFSAIGLCKICAMKGKKDAANSSVYQEVTTREPTRNVVFSSSVNAASSIQMEFTNPVTANPGQNPTYSPSNAPQQQWNHPPTGGPGHISAGFPSAPPLDSPNYDDPPPDYNTATGASKF